MVMAEQLIDGRVIEACRQGDRDAFRLLFETYKEKMFSIAVHSHAPVSRRLGVYDVALSPRGQRLSRRKAPPPQIVAVGRDGGHEEAWRKETAGEAVRAARERGGGAGGDRRAKAEVSSADPAEVHRGFVVRRDCERDG